MTWDHPRGYGPLAAFDPTQTLVRWDRQPLAEFEAHPIGELAARYDLMVIDHPGLGAAVATGALLPLGTLFTPAELQQWQGTSIGSTWASYQLDGEQWALPIDAAAQVSVRRPDLVGDPPSTWTGVKRVFEQVPSALCLGGPHALLMLLAMCASSGPSSVPLVRHAVGARALELLQDLWFRGDQEVSRLDPIGVHEALAGESGVAYCPLVYGYATYARSENPLAWSNAPTGEWSGPGSVLGGTGLAVSSRTATDHDAVREFVRGYLDPAVQLGLVPEHGGQPVHRAVWRAGAADDAWGGYYSSTAATVAQAWVRPRHAGWIPFQDWASELVRAAVTGRDRPGPVVDELNARYADSLEDA